MTDRFKNYGEAAAAMQAGVSLKMELGNSLETQAKHLRVGLNVQLVSHGALVSLLIKKGIFTYTEYHEALLDGMEDEVVAYETELSKITGKTVTLGYNKEQGVGYVNIATPNGRPVVAMEPIEPGGFKRRNRLSAPEWLDRKKPKS